jgi:hypothetical protein
MQRPIVVFNYEDIAMRAAVAQLDRPVQDTVPWGDVPLAPRELTGMSQAELARAMAEELLDSTPGASAPATAAQALAALRRAFPHAPLTARVAALAALMRR